jgi:putative membrane protein
MFIDYLTLLLINMTAGLVMLACYVLMDLDAGNSKRWAPGFAIVGLVAFIGGFHITFTWPLPDGRYDLAFGEMSVLFGALYLGAALAMSRNWELFSLAIYAFFAGLAAFIIGVRMIGVGLTREPRLSGAGFILSGLCGVFALPAIFLRTNRPVRIIGAVILVAAAFIWASTGYSAYRAHLSDNAPPARWLPTTMLHASEK